MCFVDLSKLPVESRPGKHEGSGFYVMVEPAVRVTEENEIAMSDMFIPCVKEINDTAAINLDLTKLQLYPVEKIEGATCLIPDLDNPNPRSYLQIVPKAQWADQFEEWLHTDHEVNFAEPNP